jgi:DNA modification methylase
MSIDLYHGDCLEIMKQLPNKSIDCFICDLPYGQLSGRAIGKAAENKKCFSGNADGCAWDVKIDLKEFWNQVERLAKDDHTPIIHFCNTKFGIDLINSKPDWFRYDLVWNKQRGVSFLMANKSPMRSHEMIYVFAKKGAYYNRVDIKGKFMNWSSKINDDKNTTVYSSGMPNGWKNNGNDGTTRCALSVIQLSKQFRNGHPTEKPRDLYKWLIERYCPANGTLLDPTAGSFNSCFAGYELDRNCIGIEKDDKFYKKGCERADALSEVN